MSKVKTIQGATMNDLGLNPNLQRILAVHSPEAIITAARNGRLTDLDQVGERRAEQITQKLTAAGYIFSESAQSKATRRLLAVICVIPNYNSVEEYEARQEFTTEQIDYVRHVLVPSLPPREARVIAARFGLDSGTPIDLETCGRQENATRERIRQIEAKALNKLRHSDRTREILQHFPEFAQEQESGPVYSAYAHFFTPHSVEFADTIAGEPDVPTYQTAVEILKLPKRIYSDLRLAGINNVGQLLRLKDYPLNRICHRSQDDVMDVLAQLHQLDLSLALSAEVASSI